MSDDRWQNAGDDKEHTGGGDEKDKDVEGHNFGPPETTDPGRSSGDDTDDPDVEGHNFGPPDQTSID